MNLIPDVNDPGNNQVEEPSRLKRFAGKFVEVASTTTSTVASWGSAVSTSVSQTLFGRVVEHPEQGSNDSPFESCKFIARVLVKSTSRTSLERVEYYLLNQFSRNVLGKTAQRSHSNPLDALELYLDLIEFQSKELSESERTELSDMLKDFDLDAVIKDVARTLKYGTPDEKDQAGKLLNTLVAHPTGKAHVIELIDITAKSLLESLELHHENGLIGEKTESWEEPLLLALAKTQDASVSTLAIAAIIDMDTKHYVVGRDCANSLLEALFRDEQAPIHTRTEAAMHLAENGGDAKKAEACNILLSIAENETHPLHTRTEAAIHLAKNGDDAKKAEACNILLSIAGNETHPLHTRTEAAAQAIEYCNASQKNQASELLMDIAGNKHIPAHKQLDLALLLLKKGSIESRTPVLLFIESLLESPIEEPGDIPLDMRISTARNIGEIVRGTALNDAPEVKDKLISYLADHVLNDTDLGEERAFLRQVCGDIIRALEEQEEDPRYQVALGILTQFQGPVERNCYTVHKGASDKRKVLKHEEIQDHIPPAVELDGNAYILDAEYIQLQMPEIALDDMPHATSEQFKELFMHLKDALGRCSKEQKAMIAGIRDVDAITEERLNAKIKALIGTYEACLGTRAIQGWMTPHVQGHFNRTKYELQALVETIYKDLVAWKESEAQHGDELSPVASQALQLFINITQCSSGKRAGIRRAFVSTPGLKEPVNNNILTGRCSPEIHALLNSQEESAISVRPAVLEFIESTYETYKAFREDLLDGDSPFVQGFTGKNNHPSHQRGYVRHVLAESLGLLRPSERISLDIYGQMVHSSLEHASGPDLLNAYFNTDFGTEGETKGFTEALIDKFHAQWSELSYELISDMLKAAGMNPADCYDMDDDTFEVTLKKSAVAELLCKMGVLSQAPVAQ